MRVLASALFCTVLLASVAHAEPGSPQPAGDVDERLAAVEKRIALYKEGQESFVAGLASFNPRLRDIACAAYPVSTSSETIAQIKGDIAALDQPDVRKSLTPDQAVRLEAQRAAAAQLKPTIDCGKKK